MTDYASTEAGKELDALVADEVMGWIECNHDGCKPWGDGKYHDPSNKYRTHSFAAFSTSIEAAWLVVEKMQETMDVELYRVHNIEAVEGPTAWMCKFGELIGGTRAGYGTAPTAPLAICRASLAALAAMEGK